MARPLRLEFDGATYHVISRGLEQRRIFGGRGDYLQLLKFISRMSEKFEVKIFAYCLMSNHYHVLLETTKPNLSRAMQYINSSYSGYFNYTHKRAGHLFQGRYRAILVEKDSYLLELTRYIHLNPVRAGMVKEGTEWPWSSYLAYAGMEKPSGWLWTDEVLGRFSVTESTARIQYKQFMEDRLKEKLKENPLAGVVYQTFLGGQRFVEDMKERERRPSEEISQGKAFGARDPEKVIRFVKQQSLNSAWEKKLCVYFVRKYTDLSLKQVCERFGGGHYSRISQLVRRLGFEMEHDKRLKKSVEALDRLMSNVKM